MSTLDLFDDTFPHGTPDGYRQGCRTIACPALIPCRTVHTRYSGDYAFARMIDAGTPLSEILERDAAAKEGIQQRDRAAARRQQAAPAPRRAASKSKTAPRAKGASHPAAPATSTPASSAPPIRPLRPHPGYEWLTRAAADIDKIPEANRSQRQQDLADYRTALDRHVAAFEQWRQQRATLRRQVAAAAGTLRTATIAAGSGLSVNGAIEIALQRATADHQDVVDELARLEQQRPTAPRKPRMPRSPRAPRAPRPRQLQPHGTNACRARGCDRPECIEAAREYHREWMEARKAKSVPLEHHGSAYGYQLGCKDRENCPAEISCADASLAEERRRRRDAGIAEQAPRVAAEPVREHVRQLMAAGMTVIGIAEKAGVSKTGVKILLYGRSGARKGELPREIEEAKAQRILDLHRYQVLSMSPSSPTLGTTKERPLTHQKYHTLGTSEAAREAISDLVRSGRISENRYKAERGRVHRIEDFGHDRPERAAGSMLEDSMTEYGLDPAVSPTDSRGRSA